ncbi:MAG: hypothetical protein IT289_05650 [Oligoflexia bacterium]|nr:hypothetical protein [Oligoflexia bacterium]
MKSSQVFCLGLVSAALFVGCAKKSNEVESGEASTLIPAPVVTTPASLTINSAVNAQTIAGTCNDGYDVVLSGDVDASEVTGGSLSVACSGDAFSFVVTKTAAGSYLVYVRQVSASGFLSDAVTIDWTHL